MALDELADVGRDPMRGGYSRHGFDAAELTLREWFAEAAGRVGLVGGLLERPVRPALAVHHPDQGGPAV